MPSVFLLHILISIQSEIWMSCKMQTNIWKLKMSKQVGFRPDPVPKIDLSDKGHSLVTLISGG